MLPFKSLFAELLAPHISELTHEQIIDLIETPPQGLWADLAFPCFVLSKLLKKSPAQIANEIANEITNLPTYQIASVGPYINITFSPLFVFEQTIATSYKLQATEIW